MVGTGGSVFVSGNGLLGKGQLDDGVDGRAGDGRLKIGGNGILCEVVLLGVESDNGKKHCQSEKYSFEHYFLF